MHRQRHPPSTSKLAAGQLRPGKQGQAGPRKVALPREGRGGWEMVCWEMVWEMVWKMVCILTWTVHMLTCTLAPKATPNTLHPTPHTTRSTRNLGDILHDELELEPVLALVHIVQLPVEARRKFVLRFPLPPSDSAPTRTQAGARERKRESERERAKERGGGGKRRLLASRSALSSAQRK